MAFTFTLPGHSIVTLTGTVRHCLRLYLPDGTYIFLAGFEFDLTPDEETVLESLLAEAKRQAAMDV